MKPIKMVDLYGQYYHIKDEVDTAIQEVIDTTAFIKGKAVHEFQKELEDYLGGANVVPCGNGTDALQIALMAIGVQPGDEIITPDFTFISTAEVAAVLGAKPVFVDVDPESFTITSEQIKNAITSKTKAIIPVHLFGQCTHMESIMQVAEDNGLYVVEDAAQALGADYIFEDKNRKKAGTIGHLGITSFFPTKNLSCFGDGGAIFSNSQVLAEKCRAIANHGMKRKYYNDYIGVNSRLDTIQAAILREKLPCLDQYNKLRKWAADQYDTYFNNYKTIKIPQRVPYSTHIFHQYSIVLNDEHLDRNEIQSYLKENGIPSMIYYPLPLHRQNAYSYLQYDENDFPVSNHLSERVLSLPMHTELTEEQIKYTAQTLINMIQ